MSLSRPVNTRVLQQHLEECAFYWTRRQSALWSPAFDRLDVARLDGLVAANLRGVRLAGRPAIAAALRNFSRWKSADEAFVATYTLLQLATVEGPASYPFRELEQLILDNPGSVEGAAAAFFWSGAGRSNPCLKYWWHSNDATLMRAALPALIAFSDARELLIEQALSHESGAIRARAVRAIGQHRITAFNKRVQTYLTDEANDVQFEAAAAIYSMGHRGHADVVLKAMQVSPPNSTGWPVDNSTETNKRQTVGPDEVTTISATRGGLRKLLFWSAMSLDGQFMPWVQDCLSDPQRVRDAIWSLTFRGESTAFAILSQLLERRTETTLAAYAICHLTGLDLEAADLFAVDSTEEPTTDAPEDAHDFFATDSPVNDSLVDDGLLEPDVPKLQEWLDSYLEQTHFTSGQRYLAGRPLTEAAEEQLGSGSQPARWQAALFLTRHGSVAELMRGLANPSDGV